MDNLAYHIKLYNLISFCGSLQVYKIHVDMEIMNTVHETNKISTSDVKKQSQNKSVPHI